VAACRCTPSIFGESTGALPKVLGESSVQISLGQWQDLLLQGVIEKPFVAVSWIDLRITLTQGSGESLAKHLRSHLFLLG
jgi:hypothetical protein